MSIYETLVTKHYNEKVNKQLNDIIKSKIFGFIGKVCQYNLFALFTIDGKPLTEVHNKADDWNWLAFEYRIYCDVKYLNVENQTSPPVVENILVNLKAEDDDETYWIEGLPLIMFDEIAQFESKYLPDFQAKIASRQEIIKKKKHSQLIEQIKFHEKELRRLTEEENK